MKNYYRVWYNDNTKNQKKFIIIKAYTGKEAKIEARKQLNNAKIGAVWKVNI